MSDFVPLLCEFPHIDLYGESARGKGTLPLHREDGYPLTERAIYFD